jgi:hypothetical protein
MKVAILQPGVKPEAFTSREGFDLVIAIDQAAASHAGDWWVVTSPDVFEATKPAGSPGLLTSLDTETGILDGPDAERFESIPAERRKRYEPLWERYPASLGWSLYPTAAAMVLGASLGGTEFVVVHGADTPDRPADCRKCETQVLDGLRKHLSPVPKPNPPAVKA